jgi:hypothetical protein
MAIDFTKGEWLTDANGYHYSKTEYEYVYGAMNACNGIALLNTFGTRVRDYILFELEKNNGRSTDNQNQHPMMLVMCDKLLQLGHVFVSTETLSKAYDVLLTRAGR